MYKKGYRHGHRDYSDDDLLHSDESLDEEMKANMPTVEELLVKLEYAKSDKRFRHTMDQTQDLEMLIQ